MLCKYGIGNHNVDSEPKKYVVRKGKWSFVLRFKMPKASQLSNKEVSKILHLKLLGKTVKEISKLLNRSKSMIYHVLTRKTPYEPKPCSRRPRVTDIRSDRRIQNMSSSQKMSVFEITRASRLQFSKNTVHIRIIESGYMIHEKMARRLPLSKLHISKRLHYNGLVIICHVMINGWLFFPVMKKMEPPWA
ncbi:hypothetical protein AVEN_143648-1 [Araneus ventricosus]|uniref:Transposase IS30-like HTH domain-containing protein n=1 Tax=Araneus ventricosus TaxID=182803 RepID=A0A4Y2ANG9_ARAVE|nr:hypothetical protein AVEN_143648-1 [Araneus ventricosus]